MRTNLAIKCATYRRSNDGRKSCLLEPPITRKPRRYQADVDQVARFICHANSTHVLQSLWRGLGWSGRKTFSCVHKIPIDSLRVFSNSPAIVYLFGARRLSQHNLISFLSRAPKRCLPRIYEGIPQVDYFLALSCSRRACGDEFPMNSTKQLHGFPPSAWKELS